MSARRRPRYPFYIPSKGRWEKPHTARRLDELGVPFRMVVEPSEFDHYAEAVGAERLLVLPVDNPGSSIPARNFIWDHAAAAGAERHWIIDDNVIRFYRVNFNRRIPVSTPAIFAAAEDFVDRFTNVALAGLNNIAFVPDRSARLPPYTLNTRIYSMSLIDTSLPFRWRGRWNEDTDLSLRALKAGFCTVQFNVFAGDKATTQTMRGGNTDTVYAGGDHRRRFAESLRDQHPDRVKVVWKFNRWHHEVDYAFPQRLEYREGVVPTGAPDEYGMVLRRRGSKS